MSTHPVILVGVDDSPASGHALAWAISHARALAGTVEAVAVHAAGEPHARSQAQEVVERAVAEATTGVEAGPVAELVAPGDPGDVLALMSAHADMLVIGRHATTGLRHSAEPSTAERCALLATCPVTIVPGPSPRPARDDLPVAPALADPPAGVRSET